MGSLSDWAIVEITSDADGWDVSVACPEYTSEELGLIGMSLRITNDDIYRSGGGFMAVVFLAQEAICQRYIPTQIH